ncbi:putative C6 zinc finger domain-containing protein [Rosellinia necatrix]|uniref:Putative C6 zinc finger domain-containing protein n=1 Tax=Rosellinia necatrix TaxID=77044 RepID=A0A1W2TTV0_ROSNE|nr:putative C6 zinc finger domain-containing protein [Rosellinia necatrix]
MWKSSFPDWIEIAHGLHTSDKATQLALLSFGLFAAGESQSAVQSYCYALRKLQASLCVPRKAQGDSTLATCQLLGLFEVFHGADDDKISQGFKWHSHLNGLLAVIHTRKPSGYQSGASHQLFVEGRYPLLISALKNRQHFPLNSPEWRTIPWKKEPKSFLDKLYDVLADMCDILADTDEMRRCDDPATKTIRHGEVVDAYQRADESLRDWFIEASPLTIFHDCEGTLIDPTGPSDMLLAHMTLLYWSLCFILYSTFISIYEPPLLDIPTNINPLPYLQRVARALPYFWRPGAGMCGANLAAPIWGMCLHIAYATSDRYPEEIRDLERISLQPNVANSILPFLQSLQRSSVGLEMAGLEGREGTILRAQRWIMGQL